MAYIGQAPTPLPLTATDIPDLPATKITSGTFPALNGSNLTNLDASDLTGTLPAISGANLTGITANAGTKSFGAYRSDNNASDLTNGDNSELVFNAEKHDDDGLYNVSNGRYTPGVAGIYYVSAHVTVNDINGTGDDLYLKFCISGDVSTVANSQTRYAGGGSNFTDVHASASIKLTNNSDYISVFIYQDAGGSRKPQANLSWFYGFRLS
jgi:hypothetical protein